ncbi:COG3415 family protein [Skermanella mucosa]|uniref:hypothetical protein n=1 Tax=Skermanella mucosa TaxID=1789672 RepID=UPI00389B37E4
MGHGYSSDLRVRIIGSIESGNSCRAAARRFGVSPSTSIRLAQRKARTGSLEPMRQGRPPGGGKLAPHADLLIGWVKAKGDLDFGHPKWDYERLRIGFDRSGGISGGLDEPDVDGARNFMARQSG